MDWRNITTVLVRLMKLHCCFIFIITSLCLFNKSFGQKNTVNIYDSIYSSIHTEFVLLPNIAQKAKIVHYDPLAAYKLFSTPQICGEIGVNRIMHFNKFYSLKLGIHLGIIGRNASFIVPYKEVGFQENGLYEFTRVLAREYDIPYVSVPLALEKRVFISTKEALFFDAGLNARLTWGGSGSGDANIMELSVNANRLPIINFNLGAGYQFVTKKFHLFKIGVRVNASPFWLAKGNYVLNTLSSYDYGEYQINGSSIGLSISFTVPKISSFIKK